MIQIINQIIQYINSLDWSYIITLILLAHIANYSKVVEWLSRVTKVKIQTRYRVLFVGVFYGIVLFYLRGYTVVMVESLLQSFVFAMVFHKLIIEKVVQKMIGQKRHNL